ncbi:MAG: NAD-binding protein [Peptoniphilus sp.]|nr:NAD-binding protein [Peptoniphilus sp.]MDD7363453.1 NAD-binding protein [Bacillota bacterium]MDY6044843.1 NAD-binding protein [Peptoniphilus sp.]
MKKAKHILLIGGKNKAKSLALSLREKGYRITIINKNKEDALELSKLKGVTVVHGDGTKHYLLEDAGADDCDICIALTSKDEDNLVACQLCKRQFNVEKTVSIVTDPKKIDFFYQMGVDSVVCVVSTVTSIIEHKAFLDKFAHAVPLAEGQVQVLEVQIDAASPANGKKLWEIEWPKGSIVGCILRRDKTIVPQGDTLIRAGDTLVVIVGNEEELETVEALAGRAQ